MSSKGAILIVDDEAIILLALKRELFGRYNDEYVLETALNATDANAVIDELAADGIKIILIISDWLMPGIKGDEFLVGVKKRHPGVRCIMLSGHADETDVAALKERIGLDAFLRKPWSREALLAAVDACVES